MSGGLSISPTAIRLTGTERQLATIEADLGSMLIGCQHELRELPVDGTASLRALVALLTDGVVLMAGAQKPAVVS